MIGGGPDRITQVVSSGGGAVGKVDRWGRKRLAFEIASSTRASTWCSTSRRTPAIKELDRMLSLADEVLRFKVVVEGERRT